MKYLAALLLTFVAVTCQAAQDRLPNPCELGSAIAHDAYLYGIADAQRAPGSQLKYLVDYYADMTPLRVDRAAAYRAIYFIADKVQATGARRPSPALIYQAYSEFVDKQCQQSEQK